MNIKVYCMQKNESDILEEWIIYHSYLFGSNNIYIIDNNSTDKSNDIYNKYKDIINISYSDDYKHKGDVIFSLIKKTSNFNDIVVPLDIDEFICFHENDENDENDESFIFEKKQIIKEFENQTQNQTQNQRYSFKYYLSSINNKLYYRNPIMEIENFEIVDLGDLNKKFFTSGYLKQLDHGNHMGMVSNNSNNYVKTNLVLVHYHYRGIIKLIEKCKNDILGLNGKHLKISNENINNLKTLKKIKSSTPGHHNIKTYIQFLEQGSYSLLDNNLGLISTGLSDFFTKK